MSNSMFADTLSVLNKGLILQKQKSRLLRCARQSKIFLNWPRLEMRRVQRLFLMISNSLISRKPANVPCYDTALNSIGCRKLIMAEDMENVKEAKPNLGRPIQQARVVGIPEKSMKVPILIAGFSEDIAEIIFDGSKKHLFFSYSPSPFC